MTTNQRRRGTAAVQRSLPAPIGGLNYRDPISELKITEALVMDNYFPSTSSVTLRNGFTVWATDLPAAVETLMEYANPTGRKLFAASATAIYDATVAGGVGAAVKSGLTNARWQHVQFNNNSGSDFLVAVNGADGVLTWDGATWATQAITVATPANFKNVCVYSKRLWFTENSSTNVWYLGTGAVNGAATAIDLGQQFQLGGVLAFAESVSFTGGSTMEDLIAFISTNGEVLVYRNDPTASFQLIGRFRCGRPTGNRGYLRFGGDIIVLTEYGIVSLTALTQVGLEKAPRASFSNLIDSELTAQRRLYSANFGFQIIDYPQGNMALVNVPQSGSTYVQYAMNTLTGAWCRFTGMNAACWGLLSENLYFGGFNTVYKADTNSSDNGAAVAGEIRGAFTRLGSDGTKRFTMIRPLLTANGTPAISLGVDADYSDITPPVVTLSQTQDALWNSGIWDAALWGGTSSLHDDWFCISGIGVSMALRLKTSTIGLAIQLHAIDVMYEPVPHAAL